MEDPADAVRGRRAWGELRAKAGGLLVRVGIACGVALVPLAVVPSASNPFGPAKALALATSAALVVFAMVLDPVLAARALATLRRSPAACWIAVLLGISGVATLASVEPRLALLGSYPDYRGLVSMLAVGVLACGALALPSPGALVRLLSRAAVCAALAVCTLGFLERLLMPPADEFVRVGSTLGNSSNLGVFLVLVLPLLFGVVRSADEPRAWRLLAAVAAGWSLLLLVWTSSRGAWAGAVAAVVAWACVEGLRATRRQRIAGAAAILAVFALLAGATLSTAAGGARVRSAFDSRSSSANIRFSTWRSAFRMTEDRPLLGFGPNTFAIAYPAYREPGAEDGSRGYRVMESAHNLFADTATSTGMVGLAVLVAALVAATASVLRRGRSDAHDAWLAPLAASVCGAFVALQFHYVTMDTAPLLGVVFAALCAVQPGPEVSVPRLRRPARFALAGLLPVALLGVVMTAGMLAADARLRHMSAEVGGSWSAAASDAAAARRLAPLEPAVDSAIGEAASKALCGRQAYAAYAAGRAAYARLLAASPRDAIGWTNRGRFLLIAASELKRPGLAEEALSSYRRAVKLDPFNGVPLADLAEAMRASGDEEAARAVLGRAIRLSPRYQPARRGLVRDPGGEEARGVNEFETNVTAMRR